MPFDQPYLINAPHLVRPGEQHSCPGLWWSHITRPFSNHSALTTFAPIIANYASTAGRIFSQCGQFFRGDRLNTYQWLIKATGTTQYAVLQYHWITTWHRRSHNVIVPYTSVSLVPFPQTKWQHFAMSLGTEAQGEKTTEFSTFKPAGLVAASDVVKAEDSGGKGSGSDGVRSEPVKAEESREKGSANDQATPPQGMQCNCPRTMRSFNSVRLLVSIWVVSYSTCV